MTEQTFGPELAAALVAFQAEAPKVHKGKTADTGKFRYNYADLADIVDAAAPVLAKHGLAFVCGAQAGPNGYELVGHLIHSSGQYLSGALPLSGRDEQQLGSSITYLRRYLLGCLSGIVTDDDDDGAAATQGRREQRQQQPQAQQETPLQTAQRGIAQARDFETLERVGKWAADQGLWDKVLDQYTARTADLKAGAAV